MSSIPPSGTAKATIAALQAEANKQAGLDLYQVNLACGILARTLEKIHGGEWIAHISHEANAEFVMVRPTLRKRRASA